MVSAKGQSSRPRKPSASWPKGSRSARWKAFISTAIIDGLIHRKFVGVADNLGHRRFSLQDLSPRELYAGAAHFLIFAGCIILLIGTAMDVISHYGYDFLIGNVYLGHTIALDIAGVAVILGLFQSSLGLVVARGKYLIFCLRGSQQRCPAGNSPFPVVVPRSFSSRSYDLYCPFLESALAYYRLSVQCLSP